MKWESHSVAETKALGKKWAQSLKKGDVVSLEGDLGSGKTAFAKGMARGLGLKNADQIVQSPTFVTAQEYPTRIPLFHLDLYKFDSLSPMDTLMIQEYLERPGILVVEWGQKAQHLYPLPYWQVQIESLNENKRVITVRHHEE